MIGPHCEDVSKAADEALDLTIILLGNRDHHERDGKEVEALRRSVAAEFDDRRQRIIFGSLVSKSTVLILKD